jgi:hypothetical protein
MGTYRGLKYYSVVRVHVNGNWIAFKVSFIWLQTILSHRHVEQQILFEKLIHKGGNRWWPSLVAAKLDRFWPSGCRTNINFVLQSTNTPLWSITGVFFCLFYSEYMLGCWKATSADLKYWIVTAKLLNVYIYTF